MQNAKWSAEILSVFSLRPSALSAVNTPPALVRRHGMAEVLDWRRVDDEAAFARFAAQALRRGIDLEDLAGVRFK